MLPGMAQAFDTITAVRRLEDAGLSREAAEAITASDLEAAAAGQPVTRADLDAGLASLEARMLERLQASERRTYAAVFAAAGLLFAALKLIP